MAKKLYVFGIGGTGSRVMKALTMLLAAGCRLPNEFDTVIPIIIDPDIGNGDLNRSKNILRLYQEIRNQVEKPEDFFAQELKTIHELSNHSGQINPEYYHFRLEGVEYNTFGDYIGYNSLESEESDDKSFTRLLFSKKNLQSSLDVGFKGNPNMGSIVLDQFSTSENFKRFAQTFNPEDGIFIISSIFGGTGAAGFPLLLKNLRGNSDLPNYAKIKEAKIGAITYLPYFALDKKEEIDAESFEDKARVAIDYYNRTIINKNKIDSLYFIGNRGNTKHLKYSVGGKEQRNDAHFLELAGALAVFDFCENFGARSPSSEVKEFGIERDTENIKLSDLDSISAKRISLPLTKFKLYAEYLEQGLPRALNVSRWTKSDIKLVRSNKNSPLDQFYFNSAEFNNQILEFNKYFLEWLREMKNNKPAFIPFKEVTRHNALSLINGNATEAKKGFQELDTKNCLLIDEIIDSYPEEKMHTPLIRLFERSTESALYHAGVINQI